jgi:hypothetical protein
MFGTQAFSQIAMASAPLRMASQLGVGAGRSPVHSSTAVPGLGSGPPQPAGAASNFKGWFMLVASNSLLRH